MDYQRVCCGDDTDDTMVKVAIVLLLLYGIRNMSPRLQVVCQVATASGVFLLVIGGIFWVERCDIIQLAKHRQLDESLAQPENGLIVLEETRTKPLPIMPSERDISDQATIEQYQDVQRWLKAYNQWSLLHISEALEDGILTKWEYKKLARMAATWRKFYGDTKRNQVRRELIDAIEKQSDVVNILGEDTQNKKNCLERSSPKGTFVILPAPSED